MVQEKRYTVLKKNGKVEIITAGGGFAMASKRWDSNTGETIAPEIVSINTEELMAKKDKLQSEINEIDEMIADMKLLHT
tara:strand:+ start:1461 stop:1697 length:237 start_codon:yes stop_codon:yes gene_type:complete